MQKQFMSWVSRPLSFRRDARTYRWYTLAFVSYLFVFLSFYKPFFMAYLAPFQLWTMVCLICLFTGFVIQLNHFLALKFFPELLSRWTYKQEALWILIHFALIGGYNILLVLFFVPEAIPPLRVMTSTAFVGIIPVIIDIILRYDFGKNALKAPADLLYVKSDGNYLHVFQITGDETTREIVRSPLHKFHHEHAENMVQVHKSYLVNVAAIKDVQGNSNGGQVVLLNNSHVPYSRSFYPVIKSLAS